MAWRPEILARSGNHPNGNLGLSQGRLGRDLCLLCRLLLCLEKINVSQRRAVLVRRYEELNVLVGAAFRVIQLDDARLAICLHG